jgi:chromosomal replication initiator protein
VSLRLDFTFETFVPSQCAAEALRLSAAMSTWQAAWPICVLEGTAGVGKTHLLHAIGHRTRLSGRRVTVTTARDLATEVHDAIRAQRIDELRAREPECDLLIVDDFQDLADKPATLGEVWRTLAGWTNAGIAVACASALPQTELVALKPAIEARPAIRLVEIRRPRLAEIRAITLELLARHSLTVTAADVDRITRGCEGDVRRIVGAIASLKAASQLRTTAPSAPSWMVETTIR